MEPIVLTQTDVWSLLPDRDPWGHKGDFGKLLLLCGSMGYTGAAALAARAALRSGAGLIYLGVPSSIYEVEAGKLDEPVVFPLPDREGMLSEEAVSPILKRLSGCDAVLLGPGMGQSSGVLAVVQAVLTHSASPIVLDADGINVLAPHRNILRGRTSHVILTPHDGEFRRLGGILTSDRGASAASLAQELGVHVLLKGHRTVITDGHRLYENHTGNSGMATGGSGDVLAGILVSMLGMGLPPLEAAACAAWLHGAAGDLCARRLGQYGMLPSDLIETLPRLLK